MSDVFKNMKINKKESIQKLLNFLNYENYEFKYEGETLIYDPEKFILHRPERNQLKNQNIECTDQYLERIFKKLYEDCKSRILAEESRAEELRIHHKILLTTGLCDVIIIENNKTV